MESKILLENGTNELEVLEFTIGNNHYGINVAKVKEIVPYQRVTPIPNANPAIEGLFMPRDTMITVIDLCKVINAEESQDMRTDMFIITGFNKLNIAFHVQKVIGIHRVSWENIITPDETVSNGSQGISTGIIKLNNELIVILDFEKIVTDISPETGLKVKDVEKFTHREECKSPIVIAEDSHLLMKLISDSLKESGYTNLILCNNGKEAWDYLTDVKANHKDEILENVKCIITDIEMPQMDGHRLTHLVKEDDALKVIPIIIFSSMITEEMKSKGKSLGANVQLSKPEIGLLVSEIDKLLR